MSLWDLSYVCEHNQENTLKSIEHHYINVTQSFVELELFCSEL